MSIKDDTPCEKSFIECNGNKKQLGCEDYYDMLEVWEDCWTSQVEPLQKRIKELEEIVKEFSLYIVNEKPELAYKFSIIRKAKKCLYMK